MMGTEIFKIDASWAEKLTKTRVQFLLTPTVVSLPYIGIGVKLSCFTLKFKKLAERTCACLPLHSLLKFSVIRSQSQPADSWKFDREGRNKLSVSIASKYFYTNNK